MNRKTKKATLARIALVLGAFLLAVPVLAALDEPADAEVDATSTEQTMPVSYTALGLADRNSIQLDENEAWIDNAFSYGDSAPHYGLYPTGSESVIACNSPFGPDNTQGNHYGLYDSKTIRQEEHAGSFQFKWDESKGAYSVATYSHYQGIYDGLTYKWWNVTGKKTSNHTKIQTWTGDSRKNENLFWVSYNPNTEEYRIWSALAGRPVGFTYSDLKNLKTLDSHETSTHQYFKLEAWN